MSWLWPKTLPFFAATLADNTEEVDEAIAGAGTLEGSTRLFEMAIPADMLPSLRCVGDGECPPVGPPPDIDADDAP